MRAPLHLPQLRRPACPTCDSTSSMPPNTTVICHSRLKPLPISRAVERMASAPVMLQGGRRQSGGRLSLYHTHAQLPYSSSAACPCHAHPSSDSSLFPNKHEPSQTHV